MGIFTDDFLDAQYELNRERSDKLRNAAPEMRDALLNMLGAFVREVARELHATDRVVEAIQSAIAALTTAGIDYYAHRNGE